MDFIDRLRGSLCCTLLTLTYWIDPGVNDYTMRDLVPYDVNIGRTNVQSSDEFSVSVCCKVRGIRCGELVLHGIFSLYRPKPYRTAIYIQYNGHPEPLGCDFDSISDAVYVLRLLSQGKHRAAHNRLQHASDPLVPSKVSHPSGSDEKSEMIAE